MFTIKITFIEWKIFGEHDTFYVSDAATDDFHSSASFICEQKNWYVKVIQKSQNIITWEDLTGLWMCNNDPNTIMPKRLKWLNKIF